MKARPIAAGVVLAVLAAIAFGATAPFIRMAGAHVGPLFTASLLYGGALLGTLPIPGVQRQSAPPMTRAHIPRLLFLALLGAAAAPTLLAYGLQRVSAVQGALLLNLEALFTVLFAGVVGKEAIGARVMGAAALMFVGGSIAVGTGLGVTPDWLGGLAVVGAVAAWGLDNTLTRPLAELSPAAVVRAKAGVGAVLTLGLGMVRREAMPDATNTVVLVVCGVTGYGLSLRMYLLAQRRIGAARTGSVFALAPFVGALIALILERRLPDAMTIASAALFALGVFLHLSERHAHAHAHPAMRHSHVHSHDDEHHSHHAHAVEGDHAHEHSHEAVEHDHEHAPDVHHGHAHDEPDRK